MRRNSGTSFFHSNIIDNGSDTEGELPEARISKKKDTGNSSSSDNPLYTTGSSTQEDTSSLKKSESEFFHLDERVHSVSPPLSPEPYVHPKVETWELDIDEAHDETILPSLKTEIRKCQGKLACVGISSKSSDAEIQWAMKYYDQEGIWGRPLSMMRPHIFNCGQNLRIPRMVTSPKLISLGVGAPLHPYLKRILEWYDLAPIQLPPNSYKLAIALFILYKRSKFKAPTMEEFSYFFSLRQSHKGYYFLVLNHKHNKKGFSGGKLSQEKKWKNRFFYLYDVVRIRTQFNTAPFKRTQKKLFGEAKERAKTILNLPRGSLNLKVLITEENLKEAGFLSKKVGSIVPYQKFRSGDPIKTHLKEDSSDNESNINLSNDMASTFPKGFGLDFGEDIAAPVKTRRTRLSKKENAQGLLIVKDGSPKKKRQHVRTTETFDDTILKKHKTVGSSNLSLVEAQLGPLVAPFVKEEDIHKWKNQDSKAKAEAAVKASAQLLLQSIGRVSSLEQENARFTQLETENAKLKDSEQKLHKLCDEKDGQYRFLQKEVQDQAEMLQTLNTSINSLTGENNDLKTHLDVLEEDQENGWFEEKKRVTAEAFADGFKNYVSSFMANDPDYNFSKFDGETRKWFADFRVERADEIKMKRIKLGLEMASTEGIAVKDFAVSTSVPTKVNLETLSEEDASILSIRDVPKA